MPAPSDPCGTVVRWAVLVAVCIAPLAAGSIHVQVWLPLLIVTYGAGLASWFRSHLDRAQGVEAPEVPGWRCLLALQGLVLIQLLPLPPGLLALLSPGSFAACCLGAPNGVAGRWHPVSVDPHDTLRGLGFLCGVSLLYATVFREFGEERWRRRLAGGLVVSGMLLTLAALVQEASAEPRRVYGVWRPAMDWAVFGPYVNRNHFANFQAMVAPPALAFALEAVSAAARQWRRAGFWAALGGRAGSAALLRPAAACFVLVGLLASQSRGGFVALAVSIPVLPLLSRRRIRAALVAGVLALLAVATVDLNPLLRAFETRGTGRWEAWLDMLRLFRHFPLLGAGWNAFGTAYWPYQSIQRGEFWGAAHNEYLQVLLETGIVGAALLGFLIVRLARAAVGSIGRGPLSSGVFAGIAASAVQASVCFVWQIPANALALATLCGLALSGAQPPVPARRDPTR